MPVSCNEVIAYVDGLSQVRVDAAVKKIDNCLKNDDFRNREWTGSRENPYWVVKIDCQLSDPDVAEIRKLYENAGWGEVRVNVFPKDHGLRDQNAVTYVLLFRHAPLKAKAVEPIQTAA